LKWNYEQGYVDISMPTYVNKKIIEYEHSSPKRPDFCQYLDPIKYGKHSDTITPEAESPPLNKSNKKSVQQVLRSFLYYVRAINLPILHSLQ
jgi:hypothetical protein